ncbi:MAG: hypothetical protein ACSHYF_06790 [Verrucomicrobiaceae bacterium]
MNQFWWRAGCYGLAAVVGWGVARVLRVGGEAGGGVTVPLVVEKRERDDARTGEEFLDGLVAKLLEEEVSREGQDYYSFYCKLRDSIEPAADPEGAVREAMEEFRQEIREAGVVSHSSELAVRFEHWLIADREAALAFLEDGTSYGRSIMNRFHGAAIAKGFYEREGGAGRLESIFDLPVLLRNRVYQVAIADVASRSDLAGLRQLIGTTHEGGRFYANGYGDVIGSKWSLEGRDELVSYLKGKQQVEAIGAMVERLGAGEKIPWIRKLMGEGVMDEEAVKEFSRMGWQMTEGGDQSLDERYALIREIGELGGSPFNVSERNFKTGVVTGGVRRFIDSEGDWGYALRHGEVTAKEVMEAAREAMPQAAEHESEFRSQLYRHLAEDNPEAALLLFDGWKADAQKWQQIYAARWWFNNVDPEKFYELNTAIPMPVWDERVQKDLWAGWQAKTQVNLTRFGEDYLGWVKTLPDDVHRSRALQTLIHESKAEYPGIAREAQEIYDQRKR